MPVELGKLQLTKIHRVRTLENAHFVYQRIPGKAGSAAQDLGRASVRLQIEGIFYGPHRQDEIEQLRTLYLKREPIEFIADLFKQSYVSQVILERFEVAEAAEQPEQFSYSLIISEYVPPPKKVAGTAAVGKNIKVEAKAMLDIATLPEALSFGALPEISNPFVPLKSALDPVKKATSGLHDSVSGLKTLLGV
jgi:hypothetical protein